MQQPPPYSQQYFLPRRKQRVFDPGAMSRGDWWTVGAYIGLFVLGGASLIALIPGYFSSFDTEEQALFGINLILYTTFFILAMVQCGAHFFESFKTMKYYPWAKWLMLPGGWLLTIILSALVTTIFGGPQISENQQALQEMSTAVPLPVMFVVTAVFGPFVEEYLFRHLLIGKLSRKLNIWVCALISTLVFAGIHFLNGGGIASVTQVLPYLMLGILMSLAYILSGKSLAYAYLLHFINNAMALLMLYLVYPLLPAGV